jgi:hypothetical protein
MQSKSCLDMAKGDPIEAEFAKEPLQIRIPRAVKRRFKAYAAMRGIEPNELFVEMWEHFERRHAAELSGQRKPDGRDRSD